MDFEQNKKIYCLVGLGNPGSNYSKTRHNIGYRLVDYIASEKQILFSNKRDIVSVATFQTEDFNLIISKPLCYMNNSGKAVKFLAEKFYLPSSNFIIAYDDFHLSLGKIRIRKNGSYGGHNGIQSIIQELGTNEIKRIKIGIGLPDGIIDKADYVLSKFLPDEEKNMSIIIENAEKIVFEILVGGIDATMNKWNNIDLSGQFN